MMDPEVDRVFQAIEEERRAAKAREADELRAEIERLRGALAEIEGISYDDFDPLGMAHEIATAALGEK